MGLHERQFLAHKLRLQSVRFGGTTAVEAYLRWTTRETPPKPTATAVAPEPHMDEPTQRSTSRQRGFTLLVVLSMLGLLAVVAASFAQMARNHVRLAAVAGEAARAEALADAGVHLAILDLIAAREGRSSPQRFALDATPFACGMGDGAAVAIAVQDEAGKVDLNIAREPLIRALVLGLGLAGREAAVDAILDYRDEDDNRRVSGAERPEYAAAGRPHGPRNGSFLAVEELSSVLGLTQADVDRLRPFVTIHSGLDAVDANVAPKALVDVLDRGLSEGGGPGLLDGEAAPSELSAMRQRAALLPPQFLAASTRRAFAIRAEARTANGTVFVRDAIVEFVAPTSQAFILRRWFRGPAPLGAPAAETLPPC
jgi:general secretion pathway protein K